MLFSITNVDKLILYVYYWIMDKGDEVKLDDGKRVTIVNLPTSFMANGSYEVLHQETQLKFWVKSENILYKIDKKNDDDLNNYFEFIFDDGGLNLIPKNIVSIDIESDREDINRIKLKFNDDTLKHQVCNIHIGDTTINDKDKITIRPKKEEKSKIEKIINVLKEKKDEI